MNYCLEFHSFGLNLTFVSEKEKSTHFVEFFTFPKTLNLAPGQGVRDQDVLVFSHCFFVLAS